MQRIPRRFWQTATAGVAMSLLTVGASAQMGTETEEPQQPEAIESQTDDQASGDDQAFGAEADREQGLKIGTVDLVAVSKAYERANRDKPESDGLQSPAGADDQDPGATDVQGAGESDSARTDLSEPADATGEDAADTTHDLQQPQQESDPLRQSHELDRDDSGIDQQMIDEVRSKAREVADNEGVDLIVLEVLHDEQGADFEKVDLTQKVIDQIEGGSDREQSPFGQQGQSDLESRDAGEQDLQDDADEDADRLDR